MKGTLLIPVSLIYLVLIATIPLQNAASALTKADDVEAGDGVHSHAKINCAVVGSECESHSQCCSFYCLNGICTCVAKGKRCTIDTDCCKFKSGAKCKSGKCSA